MILKILNFLLNHEFLSDDQSFTVIISGSNFNTTLSNNYRITSSNLQYNISYFVPISKYMPDESINLIFR